MFVFAVGCNELMLAVRNDHLTVWVLTDVASVLLQLENDLSKSHSELLGELH